MSAVIWKGNADLRPLLIPLPQLDEDRENARIHLDKNLTTIQQSVQTFGQVKPLVGWAPPCGQCAGMKWTLARGCCRLIVMCGNGTLSRLRALGWTHAAVSIFEGKKHEARALAIADNKASDFAEWNEELVAKQMNECAAAWAAEGSGAEGAGAAPAWVEEAITPAPEYPKVEVVSRASLAPASHPLSSVDSAFAAREAERDAAEPKTYARATAEKIASIPDGPQRVGLIDSMVRRVIKRAAVVAGEHANNHDPWDTRQTVEALADEEIKS